MIKILQENKALQAILYISIFLWVVNIIWIGHHEYESYVHFPIKRESVSTERASRVYHPGETMIVFYDSVEQETCNVTFTRIIRSLDTNHEFVIETGDFVTESGGFQRRIPRQIVLPPSLEPGKYELITQYKTGCSILDFFFPRLVEEHQIQFTVVPK